MDYLHRGLGVNSLCADLPLGTVQFANASSNASSARVRHLDQFSSESDIVPRQQMARSGGERINSTAYDIARHSESSVKS